MAGHSLAQEYVWQNISPFVTIWFHDTLIEYGFYGGRS